METFKATIELGQGFYPKIQEWEMEEGECSNLITNDGKHNHHPVAVMQKLNSDKRFKHLSLEQLSKLIEYFGKTRVSPHWGYCPNLEDKLREIQLEPIETENNVVKFGGVCCKFCDGMAWEPNNTKEYNYEKVELYNKHLSKQIIYAKLFYSGFRDSMSPVLCDDCLSIARSIKIVNYNHRYDKTNALRGLLTLITSRYKTKKGKRHDTRNFIAQNAGRANRKLRDAGALP